jgi:PhnB protein
MKLGDVFIAGDDTLESAVLKLPPVTYTSIVYGSDTQEEADRVFNALADGGKVISPNTMYPWGYYGALIDRFGVKWASGTAPGNMVKRATPTETPCMK